MVSQIKSSRFRCVCLMAAMVLLVPAATSAQKASTPQAKLDLALYYYNNDDLTEKAEQGFKQLLKERYEQTPQYEMAQYYLASYYQRKFYIQLAKRRYRDWDTLKQAAAEYRNYTDKFYKRGNQTWLSDAFFNLAMVYLQLDDRSSAINELSKMRHAAKIDSSVYIYQVVWSPQSQTVVDDYVPSSRLAEYSLSLAQNNEVFDRTVLLIQKWCQSQRGSMRQAK